MHFEEYAMFDVFLRLWGFERTFLVDLGVLRSTLDPSGSLPMKMPPLGGISDKTPLEAGVLTEPVWPC